VQNDVFPGDDVDRQRRVAGDSGRLPTVEHQLVEGSVFADEDINLKPARQVDDVEAGLPPDRLADRRRANVVVRPERGGDFGFAAGERLDGDVGVPIEARHAVDRTGERTAKGEGDGQPAEVECDFAEGRNLETLRGIHLRNVRELRPPQCSED
jgi:hypothetical protein